MPRRLSFDGVLIVGAGLAGLSAALACAPRKALVLSAGGWSEAAASAWAQGGVAAALASDDSAELHAADTSAAGAGLVDLEMARRLAGHGPEVVHRLAGLGTPFDRDGDGAFVQGREAAHSRARVARVKGDQVGRAIMQSVWAAARAAPNVGIWDGARARALLQDASGRVRGALVERDGRLVELVAPATVLATGGLGGLFAVTTNPPGLRGEGMALAALAGAVMADPEFVQFHPTALDLGVDPAPLATEALRGEGARLVDGGGAPLMAGIHPDGDLAPRDVVARAVHQAVQSGRGAFLDARASIGDRFPEEFPAVFAACMAAGIDPRIQLMPVAPAAHYHMGGVAVDAEGRTSLPGLFAAGECASTGVHGANRLASNSLLEAAAFGWEVAAAAAAEQDPGTRPLAASATPDLPAEAVQGLRRAMSRDAGVERDAAGLGRLLEQIDLLEVRFGAAAPLAAARLVASAALDRQESRGAHYRPDFPDAAEPARRTLVTWAEIRPALMAAE